MKKLLIVALLFLSTLYAQTTITLGSDAGPVRLLLGLNDGPQPTGDSNVDLTSRYQDAGVTMVRTQDNAGPFDMTAIYPNQSADPTKDSSFNWNSTDSMFKKILDGGFEPYLRIGTVNGTTGAVTNAANWVTAAVAVVRRYTDASRWGKNAVRYVEIWNEPDNRTFWTGTPDAFNQLYVAAAKAIKAAFPSLKVGGCGFTGTQYSPLPNVQQGAFLKPFLAAVQSASAPLDFLSWHTYTNNPSDMTAAAQYFRTQMNAYGFSSAESILSEWNTDFEGPQGGDAALRTGARGSAILAGTWINLQSTDVTATMLYRGPDPSANLPTFYGMWYSDGRPKPAALAQTLFNQIARYGTRVTATSTASGILVLAARNAAGERAVLIANTSANAGSWSITGATGGGTVYRLQQIADAATAINSSTLSSLASSIPGYGVQLLTITGAASAPAMISAIAGSGGSIPPVTSITPNGYFTIYGAGCAPAGTARELQQSDVNGTFLPTNLANTCVNIGTTRAYLRYVSSSQINALTPAISGSTATVSVVTNCGMAGETSTAAVTALVAAAAPEFLYFVQNAGGQNPVAAVNSLSGAYVGPANLLPGAVYTPAKSGDLVTLFGIGFGPLVSPVVAGSAFASADSVAGVATVTIGGKLATVTYAGATPGFAGLYQVNAMVPAGLAPGNQAISATINGVQVASGGQLAVQ